MIIRAKNFTTWMTANFNASELRDIATYGASMGWYGLTYYSDTCKLYSRFKEEVWEILSTDAEGYGYNTLEMIITLRGALDITCAINFENLLVWYTAERTAKLLSERIV